MDRMIEIDGSLGEGGGQILRTSLALSLITKKPFHLKNIRARRTKPGLQAQHLMSVQAAATIGHANAQGASLGSVDLFFEPGEVQPGNYHFRIGTAGSTSLVLQTVFLPLALAEGESTVKIEGGTHVKACPCYHFLETTWRSYMSLIGFGIDLEMLRPGFYPRGGGLIEARIPGSSSSRGVEIPSLGLVTTVSGVSIVAGLPAAIAHRQSERVRQRLAKKGIQLEVAEESWTLGPGTVVLLRLDTQPAPTLFFALGERGKSAEKVADEAVAQVENYLAVRQTGVDGHSADQVLLPLALSQGQSAYRVAEITQHLLTNREVIGFFLGRRITITGEAGKSGFVEIATD